MSKRKSIGREKTLKHAGIKGTAMILLMLSTIVIAFAATAILSGEPQAATLGESQKPKTARAPPPQTAWNKTYGGTGGDDARSVEQTSDGGYIIAGGTGSFGAGGGDIWLVKTDANGIQQWNKTYGGTSGEGASSVQQTSDGGYIIAGGTGSFGAGGGDIWLVKTDANGIQQWNKTYGGTRLDEAWEVRQTSDGGYIIAGDKESSVLGWFDSWVVKTDGNGNQQWNRTYGSPHPGTEDTFARSVRQTSDGGYIVAGNKDGFMWLVRIDASGIQQWNKTYGDTYTQAYSVQQTSDGGYIVAGDKERQGITDMWIVKTDANGNYQWSNGFGGEYDIDCANSVQQTSDGGYIVAGYRSSAPDDRDFWLVKTDASGGEQWNKIYGGSKDDVAYSVQQTSDGGYIAAGHTESYGAGGWDFWLVKTQDVATPSAIHDLVAGTPTTSNITLTWTAPGDNSMCGNCSGYVVKYSTAGSISEPNWASATNYTQSWNPVKNGTTETRVISGLTSNTTYWFAIKAYDDASPRNYGDVSNSPSETTTTPTTQGIPTIVIVAAIAATAAVVVIVAVVLMKKRGSPTGTK